MNKPCIDCGTPTPRTRCDECQRAYDRNRRPSAAASNRTWRMLSRTMRRGAVCVVCGHRGDDDNPLTLDHILARVLGGPDTAMNARVLCLSCNSAKGAR